MGLDIRKQGTCLRAGLYTHKAGLHSVGVVREAESYIEISDVVQVSTKLLLYASGHHGKHECGFKYNI